MTQEKIKIVAVDGPAGSGKSSICAVVSEKIGWTYVNTGAIYRAVGIISDSMGANTSDEQEVSKCVDKICQDLKWDADVKSVFYQGRDLSAELGTVKASKLASNVAKLTEVRRKLMDLQRQLALSTGLAGAIVDGRDIGTVIFPDADLKIFMTASLSERAARRFAQLGSPDNYSVDEIAKDISSRDEQDTGREAAPLKKADDALVFDTTDLSPDEAVDALIVIFEGKNLLDR